MEDLPGQTYLFDNGAAARRKPTEDEIQKTLLDKVRVVIWKWHRGRPPKGMTWDDLSQEVTFRAFQRLKNFMHGGRFTLGEYTYMAACYSLRDIQRENMKKEDQPQDYPLLFDNGLRIPS